MDDRCSGAVVRRTQKGIENSDAGKRPVLTCLRDQGRYHSHFPHWADNLLAEFVCR